MTPLRSKRPTAADLWSDDSDDCKAHAGADASSSAGPIEGEQRRVMETPNMGARRSTGGSTCSSEGSALIGCGPGWGTPGNRRSGAIIDDRVRSRTSAPSHQVAKRRAETFIQDRTPIKRAHQVEPGPARQSAMSMHRIGLSDSSESSDEPMHRNRSIPQSSTSRSRLERHLERRKVCYVPAPDEVRETASLVVIGEDSDSSAYTDSHDKPIRVLSEFTVFNPAHDLELVSLRALEEGVEGREWEAAGLVAPAFVDEDAAAEFEDALESGGDRLQRLRLSAVLRCTIDYTKGNDPVYIETRYAWYILKIPSARYREIFRDFYMGHRITQAVISSALRVPPLSLREFVQALPGFRNDILPNSFSTQELKGAIPDIVDAVEDLEVDEPALANTPLLRVLLKHFKRANVRAVRPNISARRAQPPTKKHSAAPTRIGNLDRWVLLHENQNPTCVTPRIANLAAPYFRNLVVEGYPLQGTVVDGPTERGVYTDLNARRYLQSLLDKTHGPFACVDFKGMPVLRKRDRRNPYSYHDAAIIDGEQYNVGDIIITPAGVDVQRSAPLIPRRAEDAPDSYIGDYFWFGKILYIKADNSTAHVQWFQHGRLTVLEDLAHPQELFLTDLCDDQDLDTIVGKADLRQCAPGERSLKLDFDQFFFSLAYNSKDASFQDIVDHRHTLQNQLPPNNCPFCVMTQQQLNEQNSSRLTTDGHTTGFTLHGVKYHPGDFTMVRSNCGPCHIGTITEMEELDGAAHEDPFRISVRLFGRVADLEKRPGDVALAHEDRHLFLTDESIKVVPEQLLGLCYIPHQKSVRNLDTWLAMSTHHFYVSQKGHSRNIRSWDELTPILLKEYPLCYDCMVERLEETSLLEKFDRSSGTLKAFDPFAGVGVFGKAMTQTAGLAVTHSIEISPSAARTLKLNNPEVVVYNQCANKVLEHAVKLSRGVESALSSIDDETPLPAPPTPDDVDCILAGFPCQPHSTLNMFQRVDDVKSNLILNILAWVDHLRPKYCFFENVRGFLQFNLNSVQAGRHQLTDGIQMGGVKFLVRVLVTLGYQVRFGLLQAGHYGTPQRRVRFFLIAAQHGLLLPLLPQPTHDFPGKDALEIKFPNGDVIAPIQTGPGTAPHRTVTISDAIDDLQRWNWKNPHRIYKTPQHTPDSHEFRTIACDQDRPYCGIPGAITYDHPPRTSFQARCRRRPAKDLQHYTRSLKPDVVERVVNIPLEAGSDYRSLKPKLWEWQTANPVSYSAKRGYPAGLYGRLDASGVFPTTVTNVEPTAKQSQVINPWCKRTVTVRELARSQGFPDDFKFIAAGDNVKTMHRQIGNAVPLPLGEALGRELRAALFKKWRSEQMAVDDD